MGLPCFEALAKNLLRPMYAVIARRCFLPGADDVGRQEDARHRAVVALVIIFVVDITLEHVVVAILSATDRTAGFLFASISRAVAGGRPLLAIVGTRRIGRLSCRKNRTRHTPSWLREKFGGTLHH